MILPDLNLLLYAYQPASPHHIRAREWWEETLNGSGGLIALPHEVSLGFVRIATNPRLGKAAVSMQQATRVVLEWLRTPMVRVLLPESDHTARVFELLERAGGSGLLLADASLAVYAMRARATLCSNDGDFARFPGLDWINPLLK